MNSRRSHGFVLLRGCTCATADDRSRVAHAATWRRGLPGNQSHDGFVHVVFDVSGSLFFGVAADFADHNDGLRFGVFVEELDRVDMRGTDDRIAANSDARGLADPQLRQLMYGFVG